MGFNSVIVVLHDQLDGIENHPKKFVKSMCDAIRGFCVPGRPGLCDDCDGEGYKPYNSGGFRY